MRHPARRSEAAFATGNCWTDAPRGLTSREFVPRSNGNDISAEHRSMPVDQRLAYPWTRKHDPPEAPLIPQAPRILYPKTLAELIEICQTRSPNERLRAAGSHWALSEAAISDSTFIETHDPNNVHQALGATIYDVVPACLHDDVLTRMGNVFDPDWTLVHVQAGKRVYQLYAELDQVDDLTQEKTLAGYLKAHHNNSSYQGPWACATLGSAGGQTVVGALTTGTHGGDFRRPPIADSVVALHLVADGGKHYWIESVGAPFLPQLTNTEKLTALYDVAAYGSQPGGPSNFEIIRDNDIFNAVLISAGRFGIIYSVVLTAVPQYSLHQDRRLKVWQDIKGMINDLGSDLYTESYTGPGAVNADQDYLEIAVCMTPHANFTKNLAGVTKRWKIHPPVSTAGRSERVGQMGEFDPRIQANAFENAGKTFAYNPHPDPDKPHQPHPTMLEIACADSSFLRGVLKAVIDELGHFIDTNGVAIGTSIPAIAAAGGGGLILLAPWLLLVLVILKEILEEYDLDDRLAEQMDNIRRKVLGDSSAGPNRRAAGVFVWQMIAYKAFESQQRDDHYDAISYAVMDTHDYVELSCRTNVDSVEVFFDANDSRLVAFVDSLIAFETSQEFAGQAFLGYAALRFVGKTRASLGMERFPRTCAIEVACLRGMSGSQELVDYAVALARSPVFNGILHWGQRNDFNRQEVERIYGDSPSQPGGSLGTWRKALSRITANGRLDGFSSEFTRRTGLEVVQPRIGVLTVGPEGVLAGQTITVTWGCWSNPPGTQISLRVIGPNLATTITDNLGFVGDHQFQATLAGSYLVTIFARLLQREDAQTQTIVVA
jgi:hypothetical protein